MVTIVPISKKKNFSEALTRLESFNLISVHATLTVKLDTASAFQLNEMKRKDSTNETLIRTEKLKGNIITLSILLIHNTFYQYKTIFFHHC